MKTVDQYLVTADPVTGEWISEPQLVGTVDLDEWRKMKDTHDMHYDTYEVPNEDRVTTTTRAIAVKWVE